LTKDRADLVGPPGDETTKRRMGIQMSKAAQLLAHAERCFRLAKGPVGPTFAEELESLGNAFERKATRGSDPAAPSRVASGIAVTKIGLPASRQTLTKGALLSS
jgi:hypothetical protein